jgi:hypothetical protein
MTANEDGYAAIVDELYADGSAAVTYWRELAKSGDPMAAENVDKALDEYVLRGTPDA